MIVQFVETTDRSRLLSYWQKVFTLRQSSLIDRVGTTSQESSHASENALVWMFLGNIDHSDW